MSTSEEKAMDIMTKVGLELLAKSYYEEWVKQKQQLKSKTT